jgi:hypothetical protein
MNKKIVIILFLWSAMCSFGQEQKCPFNEHNCPGKCGLFLDNNSDSYCDYSIVAIADTIVKVKNESDTPKVSHKSSANKSTTIKKQNIIISNSETANYIETPISDVVKQEEISTPCKKKSYHLFPVLFGVLGLYLLTLIFVRFTWLKKISFRKMWNIMLTVSFLFVGITGLLLAVYIQYAYVPSYYIHLITLHYDFGVAMTVIAIFHILWHLNYYKTIFKKNLKKKNL